MEPFATKLRLGRKAAGLSQEALADAVGVSKQMISKYEAGKSAPDSAGILALGTAINRPIDYFFRAPQLDLSQVSFRKRERLSGKRLSHVKAEVADRVEAALVLEELLGVGASIEKPELNLGQLTEPNDLIDQAAVRLREVWKIGIDPISSMRELLRVHGVRVIELDLDGDFDGLSTIVNENIGIVVINRHGEEDAIRQRFTLAHELGHLILPIPAGVEEKVEEKICHRFASAFLFPPDALKEALGRNRNGVSMTELKAIRCQWGISGAAVVYRAREAGVLPARYAQAFWQLRRNNEDILYERGWGDFPSERCGYDYVRVLAARALQQDAVSFSMAAGLLNVSISEVRALAAEPTAQNL